jgi:hypothetical protein
VNMAYYKVGSNKALGVMASLAVTGGGYAAKNLWLN